MPVTSLCMIQFMFILFNIVYFQRSSRIAFHHYVPGKWIFFSSLNDKENSPFQVLIAKICNGHKWSAASKNTQIKDYMLIKKRRHPSSAPYQWSVTLSPHNFSNRYTHNVIQSIYFTGFPDKLSCVRTITDLFLPAPVLRNFLPSVGWIFQWFFISRKDSKVFS